MGRIGKSLSQQHEVKEAQDFVRQLEKFMSRRTPAAIIEVMIGLCESHIRHFSGPSPRNPEKFAAVAGIVGNMVENYSAARDILIACKADLDAATERYAPSTEAIKKALAELPEEDAAPLRDRLEGGRPSAGEGEDPN